MKNTFFRELISIIIVILLFIFFVYWTKPFELMNEDFRIDYAYLSMAILFSIISHVQMAFRYWNVLRQNNPKYTFTSSMLVHFITPILARITPMNIGETKKLFHSNLDIESATFVHMNERMIDFSILFVVSIFILIITDFLDKYVNSFVLLLFILIIAIIVMVKIDFFISIVGKYTPFTIKIRKDWYREQIKLYSAGKIIQFVFNSFFIWISTVFVYYSLSKSIGMQISLIDLAIIVSTVIVLFSITGLPGGYGVREISLTFILLQFSVSMYLATVFSLLYAIYILVIETIFAIVAYTYEKLFYQSV